MSAKRHLLTPEQERLVVAAANEAPCLVGERAWRVVVRPQRIDIRTAGDAHTRREDPHRRSTVMSCGAVALNVGTVLRALGRSVAIGILPLRADSPLVVSIRIGGRRDPTSYDRLLSDAVMGGDGYETGVGELSDYWSGAMTSLERSAQEEGAQLTFLTDSETVDVNGLLSKTDPGFEELVQDHYAKLAILSTSADTRAAWVWAGIAWQRVLLTAKLIGLSTSFVSTLLDVGETRWHVQETVGESTWPQIVLRFSTHQDSPSQVLSGSARR
ncbi:nitroreductase family protein [Flindersiella endophytica]